MTWFPSGVWYALFPCTSRELLFDPSASVTATGILKSIMKRKDGSSSDENRTTSKKSLQFVGILNGGWVEQSFIWKLKLSGGETCDPEQRKQTSLPLTTSAKT